jgi:hypothetical protein
MRPAARGDAAVQPSPARPLDAVATALMIVLCLSWGLNQVAVKLALPDIPALTQGALRSLWALPVVLLVARLRGVPLTMHDGSLAAGLTAGALFGVEFVFIFRGLVWTTASRAVVFIYTAPFFIALGARFLLHSGSRRCNGAGWRCHSSASSSPWDCPIRPSMPARWRAMGS